MYELWLIGIAAGIGVALGLAAAGAFARSARAPLLAAAVALVGGGVIGWLVFDWKAGVVGAVAGALSGFGAGTFARGAVSRGGTVGGTAAIFVASRGARFRARRFIPIVGFIEAVAIPVVATALASTRGREVRRAPHACEVSARRS